MLTATQPLRGALLLLLVAGVAGGAPSLEFHHRFSARVRRWADARGHELP
uniref:Uncharacterized protein n=4 Tax=Aegilops tauschii subsp. strangulata TaxID=200361 RepID=A0A453AGH0_AEGTS